MLYALCFLLGMLLMYLIAGAIIWMQATPLNKWFIADRKVTALAILTWPWETNRVMRAGLEHDESKDLKPRPAP